VVHGFIMTLGYSRLSCVIPVFKQDLPTVIDCFERAAGALTKSFRILAPAK
jgi:transposase